jgi:hypothetical protein
MDWGIFLADAVAAGDWTPFHSIFGQNSIEHRTITVDLLQQIIFELISSDHCYWIWASSKLPIIGDLSEARLFLQFTGARPTVLAPKALPVNLLYVRRVVSTVI